MIMVHNPKIYINYSNQAGKWKNPKFNANNNMSLVPLQTTLTLKEMGKKRTNLNKVENSILTLLTGLKTKRNVHKHHTQASKFLLSSRVAWVSNSKTSSYIF